MQSVYDKIKLDQQFEQNRIRIKKKLRNYLQIINLN